MYKEDLAVDSRQLLIWHKTKPNETVNIHWKEILWLEIIYLLEIIDHLKKK